MMRMAHNVRVLLLNPPFSKPIIRDNYCCFTSKSGYIWPPVDLLYLSGVLHHPDVELSVIDAVVSKQTWDDVYSHIRSQQTEIVICLTGTASFKEDMQGASLLKILGVERIYVLGNAPVFRPKEFLHQFSFIDGVLHNFFDPAVLPLINEDRVVTSSISHRLKNGQISIGQVNYLPLNSEIVVHSVPQYRKFPLSSYSTPIARKKPLATVLTTFGCPFSCKFCIASALRYYTRDINDLKREFDALSRVGVREIFFQDSTFNSQPERFRTLLHLLIKHKYGFSWSANIHSYYLTEEILALMKQAGCHTVQIGVESGNQATLDAYAPSKRKPNLRAVFRLCKKVGIRTLGYFIIGFPSETVNSAQQTIDFAKKLDPDFASFSVMTPDYGTALYTKAVADHLFPDLPLTSFDASRKAVLKNIHMTPKLQDRMIRKAYRDFYLRPTQIWKYLVDWRYLIHYLKNGLYLFSRS